MVPIWDSLATVKRSSESVRTKFKANSFSTPCITYGETCQCIMSMNCAIYTNYFNSKFSYLHKFYKINNIKTKPSTKFKTYIQTYIPLWPHMGHKGCRKDGKTFIKCLALL